MNPEPILIGADVGTTNIKVLAFDRGGRALEGGKLADPDPLPETGPGPLRPRRAVEHL